MRKFSNVLWGIVILVIGCIWGLNAMGVTDINLFFRGWWTLFIIIPCFIGLFKDNDRTADIIGLIIGLALLLAAQGFLKISLIMKLIVPVSLIAIGLSLIFKDLLNSKINARIKELNKDGLEEYVGIFSDQKVDVQNADFRGANLNAVFGGVHLNLKTAKINQDIIVNASAIFGGIDIYVPDNVNIKIKSTPIFGGVSNKTSNSNKENFPVLYINATCLFGGVDIK